MNRVPPQHSTRFGGSYTITAHQFIILLGTNIRFTCTSLALTVYTIVFTIMPYNVLIFHVIVVGLTGGSLGWCSQSFAKKKFVSPLTVIWLQRYVKVIASYISCIGGQLSASALNRSVNTQLIWQPPEVIFISLILPSAWNCQLQFLCSQYQLCKRLDVYS